MMFNPIYRSSFILPVLLGTSPILMMHELAKGTEWLAVFMLEHKIAEMFLLQSWDRGKTNPMFIVFFLFFPVRMRFKILMKGKPETLNKD